MASRICLPLLYLPLLLLLPQFNDAAPVPTSKNLTAHEPHQPLNTYIVHANHLAKPSYFATLGHWYSSMVSTHSSTTRALTDSSSILYTYDTVMHGFAVQLTGDEARRMSGAVGVAGVYEDRVLHFLTTRSPGFLGLDPGYGAWQDTNFGDGIIIGFVDTGIWPESPSFNDSGLGPVRSSWRGKCVGANDFNANLCNHKLVGARAFDKFSLSPRDHSGHGTHVASTAAGSEVPDVGFHMFARGTARGVAPKARIAVYKVPADSPSTADVVMAMDAAVKDGVDIISMSLGFDMLPFYNDALAIAAFGAERKGTFVVLAGGNDGPNSSTVTNVAPWMTTVGAGSVDRLFSASLNIGDGSVLPGQSLYSKKDNGTVMVPLVYSSCTADALTPDRIMGKIVLCTGDGDEPSFETMEQAIVDAGGAGLVLIETDAWYEDGTIAMEFPIPCLSLPYTAGEKLKAYMASAPDPEASFSFACETVIGKNRAPTVASSSSRGPNPVVPELLKPDIIAPGMNILAAWPGIDSPANARDNNYQLDSGTSMACPHIAGVAALVKKKHSTWTPAMIRSALITTAGTLDNTHREILDNAIVDGIGVGTAATPFATGAGHVRPQLAMDPGLVYDASPRDYVDFLCALNYTTEQLSRFAPDMAACARELPGGPAGLNYPSFGVIFDGRTDVRTLTRTVTMVSDNAETYKVTVVAPKQVKVAVTPTTLEFKQRYEKRSYTVEFRSEPGVKARWKFGHIIWENEQHQVRSPVAFMWPGEELMR